MYILMYNSKRSVDGSCVHCNVQQYTYIGGFLIYIVMYGGTHTVEGSYVHCNVQQYTDSGGFLCTL
jgi:hypothetical protein